MVYRKRKKDRKNEILISRVFEEQLKTAPSRWQALEATAKKCDYTPAGLYQALRRLGLWDKAPKGSL